MAGSLEAHTPTSAVVAKRLRKADAAATWRSALAKLAVAAAALALLLTLAFGVYVAPDDGMKSALREGDVVLFYRLGESYAAGDVVVYAAGDGETRIGRVIAVPGETVEVTEQGVLKVNGSTQALEGGARVMPAQDGATYPLLLNMTSYFVLGDNYDAACDSRMFGSVDQNDVFGKAITVLRRRSI